MRCETTANASRYCYLTRKNRHPIAYFFNHAKPVTSRRLCFVFYVRRNFRDAIRILIAGDKLNRAATFTARFNADVNFK